MLTAVEEQRSPRGLTEKVRGLDAIEACCVIKTLNVYLRRINVEREGVDGSGRTRRNELWRLPAAGASGARDYGFT